MAEVQWVRLYTSFFDNKKIRMIRRQKDGDSIVLFYLYLLTAAGKCNAGGELFFSEKKPYNRFILAEEFGCEQAFVDKALEYLTALELVEKNEEHFRILGWEEHQNAEGLEKLKEQRRQASQRYREKKRREDGAGSDMPVISRHTADKNREDSDKNREEKNNGTEPAQSDGAVLTLPLNGNKEYPIFQEDIDGWDKVYPNVDVLQQLREMREWCNANPQKRKTEKGIRKFIINWLSQEQDKGGPAREAGKTAPQRTFTPTEF